ncbi:hypothetical protein K2X05_09275 [bacterium]|nr:hypothetical protein [bacterium]
MNTYLKISIANLLFVASANAFANCQDTQILVDAAKVAIADYEASTPENDCLMCGYLLVDDEPVLEKSNIKGTDLWNVPVVADGEGCYGNVTLSVKAGTCSIIEKPTFDGVSCTDN